jgi:hypothetical protein
MWWIGVNLFAQVLVVADDLANLLRPWLSQFPPNASFWPGKRNSQHRAARIIRLDLETARLAWVAETNDPAVAEARERDADFLRSLNSDGECVDFHCLRHSYLSRLGRSSASAKIMQSMARHSTVTLTLDRYTHVALHDLDAAVNSMPALPVNQDRTTLRATGT